MNTPDVIPEFVTRLADAYEKGMPVVGGMRVGHTLARRIANAKPAASAVTNTRATVLHRDLKLQDQHFHAEMRHPVHGRMVKVFRARVVGFHPLRHADEEVYYFKNKGSRYTVDMVLWLSCELEKSIKSTNYEKKD